MHHRPEIDGLRAFAVSAVVMFHAGLPGIPGGYVGVDVFFVISGFLITSIISKEIEAGVFSIVRFYERRARRILPALIPVVAFCLMAGCQLLLPNAFVDLAQSAIATSVFASNFHFWSTTGYFRESAGLLPLLHTWSLAVEEQFYILFPLALLVVGRWHRAGMWAVALISLALSVAATTKAPSFGFYMLPTRGWELLIGGLLAVNAVPPITSKLAKEIVSVGGMIAILLSIALYTDKTPFPGIAALLPCLGTAAIIYSGGATGTARLLSRKPVVFLGLISYSVYLWHWPLLVYAKHVLVTKTLPTPIAVLCVALTLGLATISWCYIEQPFRRKLGRGAIFAGSAAGLASLAVLSGLTVVGGGFVTRFSPSALAYENSTISATGDACLNEPLSTVLTRCRIGVEGPPTFVLWGDSHAAAILPAVDLAAKRAHKSGFLFAQNSCPPVMEFDEVCTKRNRSLMASLSTTINTFILAAFWHSYENDPSFDEQLIAAIGPLMKRGRVVVLAGLPYPGFDVRWTLARNKSARPILPGPDLKIPGADMISLSDILCAEVCPLEYQGHSIFADENHLSAFAAEMLVGPKLRIWR